MSFTLTNDTDEWSDNFLAFEARTWGYVPFMEPVPEPGTWTLTAAGLLALAALRRVRRDTRRRRLLSAWALGLAALSPALGVAQVTGSSSASITNLQVQVHDLKPDDGQAAGFNLVHTGLQTQASVARPPGRMGGV